MNKHMLLSEIKHCYDDDCDLSTQQYQPVMLRLRV